jgi:glycosyltransferase involved in cell wall biosynthesis
MHIAHVGCSSHAKEVDGVTAVVWIVAEEQARSGQHVTLLLEGEPDSATKATAATKGIRLAPVKMGLESLAPDIIHFHSVFIPSHVRLGHAARKRRIPYVVTPHNGLAPQILAKGRLKKAVYSQLFERSRLRHGSAITVLSATELSSIENFIPQYPGRLVQIPNPIDPSLHTLKVDEVPAHSRPRIVFLGRFDVEHKGIDLLFSLARAMPYVDFHLHGSGSGKALEELMPSRPSNLSLLKPVYGAEKVAVLQSADIYIQMSRWEGIPISVMEAMSLGRPCAVNEAIKLSSLFEAKDLIWVLPGDPQKAAPILSQLLNTPDQLAARAETAREFVLTHFSPEKIAEQYLNVYREAIAQKS